MKGEVKEIIVCSILRLLDRKGEKRKRPSIIHKYVRGGAQVRTGNRRQIELPFSTFPLCFSVKIDLHLDSEVHAFVPHNIIKAENQWATRGRRW